jgi:cytochrome c biogenesis protein CcmG, thiol:disulfide interchange protein DsbE
MTPGRIAMLVAAAALALVVGVGVSQLARSSRSAQSDLRLTPAQTAARLAGSPAPLKALHSQANELLSGGWDALAARLRSLRGYPVVVDKWASWCEPCRSEFPIFQRAALYMGRRVAFVGLDSGDEERAKALELMSEFPVAYPSYYDPGEQAAQQLTYSSFTPMTVFIAPNGARYPRLGPYASASALERDVRRYAIGA